MKQALPALVSYLNSTDTTVVADLYTFALVGGQTLRLVDYPLASLTIPAANFPGSPLNYAASGNVTFTRGPRFGRSKVSTKIGVEPAELKIDMYPAGTGAAETLDTIGTLTWQQAAFLGVLDGASVELDRFFMPYGSDGITGPLSTALGAIVWFWGHTADVEINRSVVSISVKSPMNLLQQQQMPRRLFQSACTHIFGDAMCAYDRVNGKNALGSSTGLGAVSVTAQVGSTQTVIVAASTIPSNYVQGSLKGITGQNAGIIRGVGFTSGADVTLTRTFPYPVANGDTFQLLPGCDHTTTTCNNVMNNLLRYGGFPYIPPPELAL